MTPLKRVNFIAIHCAATPPTMNIGVDEIRGWHKAKGWSDVGYHYVIKRDGTIQFGRPQDLMGAHVQGYNVDSLGICLIGGVDAQNRAENNFTPQQFDALEVLVRVLLFQFPHAIVQGHRDFPNVNKACPSFDARAWWANLNQENPKL